MSHSYVYPFAYHTYNNGYMLVDSTGYTVYDLNENKVIAGNSRYCKKRERIGKAILQATSKDLRDRH